MKLYSENKNYKLYHGNMLDMDEVIDPESIDSIVRFNTEKVTNMLFMFWGCESLTKLK